MTLKSQYKLTTLECDLLNLLIDVEIINRECTERGEEIESVYLDEIFYKVRSRLDKDFAYHPLSAIAANENIK